MNMKRNLVIYILAAGKNCTIRLSGLGRLPGSILGKLWVEIAELSLGEVG